MSQTPILIRNFVAGSGGVAERQIVRLGAADGEVVATTAVTDTPIGVSVQPGTAAQGHRVDVAIAGVVEVTAGGSISRGDYLTTNGSGLAVAAAPASGVNNGIVGIALMSAAPGDIIPALLAQGRIQG
jgi:hypothetical protein